MNKIESIILNKTLDEFLKLKERNSKFAFLVKKIESITDIYIFGGFVRDSYLDFPINDIDIVLNISKKELEDILDGDKLNENRFGGYSITLEKLKIDIWALETTWAFNNKLIQEKIDNLIYTTYLNINSIVINVTKEIIFNHHFINSVENKVLDIVLVANPFPLLCLLRTIVIKEKTGFTYSRFLKSQLLDIIDQHSSTITKDLYDLQLAHYKKEILSFEKLKKCINKIVEDN